jgi:hypothetical protein
MSTTRGGTASAAGGGIGLGGALTVLFVALKLTGYIDWSWWWILAPLWLPAAVVILAFWFGFLIWLALPDKRKRERDGQARPDEHGPAHRWGRRG